MVAFLRSVSSHPDISDAGVVKRESESDGMEISESGIFAEEGFHEILIDIAHFAIASCAICSALLERCRGRLTRFAHPFGISDFSLRGVFPMRQVKSNLTREIESANE
jgi:hypothetical protein